MAAGWGEGERLTCCVMGIECQFSKVKILWSWAAQHCESI